MSRLRRAALATVVVQGFSLLGMALSFVAIPFYLRWLGNERYGLMLTAQACAGYMAFSDAGLSWSSLLLISQAHGRDDREAIAQIVRSSLTLAGLSGVLVGVLTLIACALLYYRFDFLPLPVTNSESIGLMFAVGVQVVVALGTSPIYNVFFGLQENHLSASYQGIARILGIGLSLLAAAHGAAVGVVVGAGVFGPLVCGVACALHVRHRHPWALSWGSFWDREQVRLQCRTGAKSFGLQIGRTLVGSAPVMAISAQAGAGFVPGFTVALTLLNMPLNVTNSFNATLQAGYGEAMGRGDFAWINATFRSILRNMLLLQVLLSVGFLALAGPTVTLWAHGRLAVHPTLLWSALIVGLLASIFGAFQFALSGVNQHKAAGISEICNGLLSLAFCTLAVRFFGYEWVGLGVLAAGLATSGWILPMQTRRHLQTERLWPRATFFGAVALAGVMTAAIGHLVQAASRAIAPGLPWLMLACVGLVITVAYIALLRWLLPTDAGRLLGILRRAKQCVVPPAPC